MANERLPSNPARLGVNDSVITGGVFNFHPPSQGKIDCHVAMNLADGDAEGSTAAVAPGARFGGLDRGRGRLSH